MITVQKLLLLRKVDLFADMTTRELGRVAGATKEVVHSAGSTIFSEGDAGDALYLVVSGDVEVVRGGERLRVLKSADYFGELAVLTGEPRGATVRALTDCLLLRLERADFHDVLAGSFDAVLAVIKTICRRRPAPDS
ncbi:MAG TPA: cyclic nucleotide-binding domain-containing protein [Thermoanaerobaculia bacterium]|nr:cyclic nucleotide-binding domain-containing protein [Thermoanaerobaculia bacterium]